MDTEGGQSWASVRAAQAYSSSMEFHRLGSLSSVVIIVAVLATATILACLVRAILVVGS